MFSITAAEIMSKPVVTVAPETGAEEIAALLSLHRISAVPVCSPTGALLGLVSEDDLLEPFRESVRAKRERWLEALAEGGSLGEEFLELVAHDNRRADGMMSRVVVTADEQATLPELAELMTARRLKRLPIVRNGKIVGVVSRSDLVAAIARAPAALV